MTDKRVTLASLDQKLEGFINEMRTHMAQDSASFGRLFDYLEGNGKPGLKTRQELVEHELGDMKESRELSIKALWTAIGGISAALALKYIWGIP